MRSTILALAALLALAVAAPAQAATAGQAARVTGKCFRAEGWKTTVTGRTVKATSPRLRPRNSFPRHPTFQVQFNELGNGRFITVQVSNALNDAETRTAKHCVNRGKRA
jgi:opacity protein-like surface antigen